FCTHEGLERVVHTHPGQLRKETRRDCPGRDLMHGLTIEHSLMFELNGQLARTDCRKKEHPRGWIPPDLVDKSFSRWDYGRRKPRLIGNSRVNAREQQRRDQEEEEKSRRR